MRPFVRDAHMDVIIMEASAGLLSGDMLDAEYRFGDSSDVSVYTQGYEKVFNTGEGHAARRLRLSVGQEACVRFLPQLVIPFTGSDFRSKMEVSLARNCRFACAEVFTCGRTGRGERFQLRRLEVRMRIMVDGRPAFAEHTRIEPAQVNYTGLGHTVRLWSGVGRTPADCSASGGCTTGWGLVCASRAVRGVCPGAGRKWRFGLSFFSVAVHANR